MNQQLRRKTAVEINDLDTEMPKPDPANLPEPLQINREVERQLIEDRSERYPHEPDHVFHPHLMGYCRRVMYNRKANLTYMDREVLGKVHMGTRHHCYLEHHIPRLHSDRTIETEIPVDRDVVVDGTRIAIKGTADVIDSRGVIYDHKFTGGLSWVRDEPKDTHVGQLHAYMYAADRRLGQVEYVLRRGEVKKGEYIEHPVPWNPEIFKRSVERAVDVLEALQSADEREGGRYNNPFSHCGCFYCKDENFVEAAKPYNEVLSGD